MRQLIIPLLLLFITSSLIISTGCKNKCGSTTCSNGGTCNNNICICPTGYSGNSCQTSWAGIAIGTYRCKNSNCNVAVAGPSSWLSVVNADGTNGGYTLDISNFDNNNLTVVATIDHSKNGTSVIHISSSNGVNATGSFDSTTSTINLQFAVYSGGTATYRCNMVMVKQ